MQYYISCHRELWFYSHGINMNYEDDNVLIGKRLHEITFKRKKKNIILDDTIAVDFISSNNGVIVFEVKKSSKMTKPAKYQLLYYLYYLKKMGISSKGVLVYPKERKRESVILSEEIESEIDEIIENIKTIVNLENPPKVQKRPHCGGCSYYDFCKV